MSISYHKSENYELDQKFKRESHPSIHTYLQFLKNMVCTDLQFRHTGDLGELIQNRPNCQSRAHNTNGPKTDQEAQRPIPGAGYYREKWSSASSYLKSYELILLCLKIRNLFPASSVQLGIWY